MDEEEKASEGEAEAPLPAGSKAPSQSVTQPPEESTSQPPAKASGQPSGAGTPKDTDRVDSPAPEPRQTPKQTSASVLPSVRPSNSTAAAPAKAETVGGRKSGSVVVSRDEGATQSSKLLPQATPSSAENERKRSSRHQKLVDELKGKLEVGDDTKFDQFSWFNSGAATDAKAWQTNAEGIRKLFEVPTAGKVNSSEGTEISQPKVDMPAPLAHKTQRLPKEWIVNCGRGDSGKQWSIELSPQNSYEDIQGFPLKVKLSEPDQPWGLLGSVRAIRGSGAPSMSAVPSRYTLQTIGTIGSRMGRSKLSSSVMSMRSENLMFDPKDEPIWQRGRRFDHPTDPNNKHFITVINTVNYDIKIMEATQGTLLRDIKERYRCYNENIDNYVWRDLFEKQLDFDLTLHDNGLVDNSYITDDTGLRYFPLIFLFFDDGFLNDPPMQLDMRKAFIRDPDILCRNYQLGLLPEPGKEDMEGFCEVDRNVANMPPDIRRQFREKCGAAERQSKVELTRSQQQLNDPFKGQGEDLRSTRPQAPREGGQTLNQISSRMREEQAGKAGGTTTGKQGNKTFSKYPSRPSEALSRKIKASLQSQTGVQSNRGSRPVEAKA